MGKSRSMIRKIDYPNPAIISRRVPGDGASQIATFKRPSASKAILNAILRSEQVNPLTPLQYASYISFIMSTHTAQVNDIINTSGRLIDALDDAFKDLQASDKMPTLRECQNEFANALVVYRDTLLKDVLGHALSTSGESNQGKLGRAAEWGSKKPWTKTQQSIGTSSKMSAVSEKDEGVVQRFAFSTMATNYSWLDLNRVSYCLCRIILRSMVGLSIPSFHAIARSGSPFRLFIYNIYTVFDHVWTCSLLARLHCGV
jgi:hypothetical protein